MSGSTKSQTLMDGPPCNTVPDANKALHGPPDYCPGHGAPDRGTRENPSRLSRTHGALRSSTLGPAGAHTGRTGVLE